MTDAFGNLAGMLRWLCWREELRGQGGKPTKIPYCPSGGYASSTDPATWALRAVAEAALPNLLAGGRNGGLGIVLGDLGHDVHLAGFDLDSCLDDGLVSDWAAQILLTARTYCETSPSGTGLKLYFYVVGDDVRPFLDKIGVRPDQWGCRRSAGPNSADHGLAIEVYCAGRYFAVTGKHWAQSPENIALLDHVVLADLAPLIPAGGTASSSAGAGGDQSRSAKAYRIASRVILQGGSYDDMLTALRADPETAAWVKDKGTANGERELKRLWQRARPETGTGVTLADFWAYMPMHNYVYAPTREPWPAASLDARLPWIPVLEADGTPRLNAKGKPLKISPSAWLDQNRPIEMMTWAPGLPLIIEDRLISQGGWIERQGVSCFNLYRPPLLVPGDAARAGPWIDHVKKIYPDDYEHVIAWLAQRVQQPDVKVNHVLVLGGSQGIGKDTLLEPVKRAIGQWNWAEPSPLQVMGRFNGFARSVVLRISEARDLGEVDRYQFYEHLKVYAAAPPDVLRVDEKHLREYSILNCCGVIITTNHKIDGIYLPADDRRHYVGWSNLTKEDFDDAYWRELWRFYDSGGDRHVAAYLAELDLAGFNPKAPPTKTETFLSIVNAGRSSEDGELADCLDHLGNPDATTLAEVLRAAETLFPPPPPLPPGVPLPKADDFSDWLKDRRNRRTIPHRFEACGYVPVRNPADVHDGQWKIKGKRQTVYARQTLTLRAQIAAAEGLR